MFKTDLDGLHHQEQIRDYLREAAHTPALQSRTGRYRKLAAAIVVSSTLIAVWGLGIVANVAALLQLGK